MAVADSPFGPSPSSAPQASWSQQSSYLGRHGVPSRARELEGAYCRLTRAVRSVRNGYPASPLVKGRCEPNEAAGDAPQRHAAVFDWIELSLQRGPRSQPCRAATAAQQRGRSNHRRPRSPPTLGLTTPASHGGPAIRISLVHPPRGASRIHPRLRSRPREYCKTHAAPAKPDPRCRSRPATAHAPRQARAAQRASTAGAPATPY